MFTIQETQAMDYLLKWLLDQDRFPLADKNLKLVIDVQGTYWYGDFVNYSDGHVKQLFIDDSGDVENTWLYASTSHPTIVLQKIRHAFHEQSTGYAFGNPFLKVTELPLLFDTLGKLVKLAKIEQDDSPIYPYLLNAKSLDGRLELPFIHLGNEMLRVVSIIELQ